MDVKVNAKSAAKTILEFVKAAGGEAKNTEVLELVARICGFDSYRAMRAVSQRKPAAINPGDAKGLIEDPAHVVFRSPMVDWELAENPDASFAEIPGGRRGEFEVLLEDFCPQFRLLVRPVGTNVDTAYGQAMLDIQIEINDGVPCVHLTNDPLGEVLLTVFGTGEGLVVREDEGTHTSVSHAPVALKEVALRNGAAQGASVHVVLNDTFSRQHDGASDIEYGQVPPKTAAAPRVVVEDVGEEKHVRVSAVVNSDQNASIVIAQFDPTVGEMQSWLDVTVMNTDEESDFKSTVAGYTVFGKELEDSPIRQAFVNAMAPLAAYFVNHDQLKYMHELVSELIVRPNALELTEKCREITTQAHSVHLACDAIEALLAVVPDGLVLAGGSEDGVVCRHCQSYFSLDDEGIALGEPCPSRKCPSHKRSKR